MFAYPTFNNHNYPLANTKQVTNSSAPISSTIDDNGAFVFNKYKTHENVTTNIQHWQLRNLLCSPSANVILHPCQNSLHMFDAKTNRDTTLYIDLPFTPTTIDTRYGYVAMAGQRGMAMVKELSGEWSALFTAGPGINNSISLSKVKDEVRVTVCNNDHTVCIMSVPAMVTVKTLKMPAAVNHASVSPNGRMMLMVADNGKAYLYEITESGDYKQKSVYEVSDEPALSCAWNQSSEKFAVTSQDGYVSVWNVEQSEPLCRIGSTETRKTRKAPRSIQFSKGPLDLLAYAEHVSTVNIVDTRTFQSRQVVRLSPIDVDYHITGLAFSPDNRSLFVGLENSIVELRVDICARRRFATPRIL